VPALLSLEGRADGSKMQPRFDVLAEVVAEAVRRQTTKRNGSMTAGDRSRRTVSTPNRYPHKSHIQWRTPVLWSSSQLLGAAGAAAGGLSFVALTGLL
jgi:hypothetical protein